jgi:succinoglycan biosynthesis transport protein ExoP
MTANPLTPIPPIGPTTAIGQAPTQTRFKPLDPLKVLRQYARLLIISGVIGIVLGVATWAVLWTQAPRYSSQSALVVLPPQRPLELSTGMQVATGDQLQTFIRTEIFRILSEEVLGTVIKRDDVRNTAWFRSFGNDTQKARERLQSDLTASPLSGTSLINLRMTAREPRDTQVILEALTRVYLDQLSTSTTLSASRDLQHLRTLSNRLDDEIRLLGDRMVDFRKRHDLGALTNANNEAIYEYNTIAQEDVRLRLGVDRARASYQTLVQAQQEGVVLDPSPADLQRVEADPAIRTRDERIRSLREEREVLLNRVGEQHQAIANIDQRIEATRRERQRELERLLQELQAVKIDEAGKVAQGIEQAIASLQPKLDAARARMTDLSNKITEYKDMETQVATARERRGRIEEQIYQGIAAQGRESRVQLHSPPTTPSLVFPRMTVVIPGITILFLGLVTGVVFLIELLDQRIKSPADVKMLPNAELLGVLPDGAEDPSGSVPIESVVKHYPTGLMAESFRHVRTALLTRMDRRGYKTLVVVGARPGSGTSAIVGNLALSLAYNGRKVLVIDANFRRPTQHQMFDVPREPGLVDVLQHGAKLESAIHHVNDPALSVLPAGTGEDAPPELLEGPQFRRMLTTFEAQYDMVLIDAPPALLASEGQLLAKHVDALALVARAMNDKRGMVERMLRVLDGQRADVLGIILNGVRSTAGGYLRQSYQEFYRYRSGASSKAAYGARRTARAGKATNGNGHDEDNGQPINGDRNVAASDEQVVDAQIDADDELNDRR